jgi:hypothetical protein
MEAKSHDYWLMSDQSMTPSRIHYYKCFQPHDASDTQLHLFIHNSWLQIDAPVPTSRLLDTSFPVSVSVSGTGTDTETGSARMVAKRSEEGERTAAGSVGSGPRTNCERVRYRFLESMVREAKEKQATRKVESVRITSALCRVPCPPRGIAMSWE